MVLRKLMLILIISVGCFANASGNFGISPGYNFSGGKNNKIFIDIYEPIGDNFYINNYMEAQETNFQNQIYLKLDLNKHYDKFNLGFGVSEIKNTFTNFQDIHATIIYKMW